MTTNLPVTKARKGLATSIAGLVLGLLALFSSIYMCLETKMALDYTGNYFSSLRSGYGWESIPQIDWHIIRGGFFIGIAAIVIGIVSRVLIRTEKVRGNGASSVGMKLAIAGIILGSLGIIFIVLAFVLYYINLIFIAG